nr:AMP-binding protein [Clostridia bacterium]
MNLLDRFLERTEFTDYEDFKKNYKLNIPENFNFGYDIVDEYARLCPEKRALIWYNNDFDVHEEYQLNFGEVKRLSDKAANAFKALGIGKGDRVMLILRQYLEVWISIVALCKIGATCIPATFQLTPKDIVYRCNSANIKMICAVDTPELVDYIEKAKPDCPSLKHVAILETGHGEGVRDGFIDYKKAINEASEDLEKVVTNNDDRMLIYFSSGTSGMPKMISHTYTYPIGHITTAKYWQHVEDDGRHLTQSDSGWAKFAWGKIFGQWIAGTELVAYDQLTKFDGKKMLEAIDHLKLTTFCAPPTIYRFIINEDMTGIDFSSLHHCCTAGEPLYPDIVNKFREATGHTIYEGFGQSETTVVLANYGWDEVKCGSTGKPAPVYDIDIVDDDGVHCEDGVVGHIVVKNAVSERPTGLFTEYIGDDDAMKRAWYNGWYDTGDMAWRDSDGYYWFEGRSDDVIKCSGYRIGPFEVESALATHPAVLESAVTAAPDPIRGQVVKATIVLKGGFEGSAALIKELQNHVKKATAPYKYPRIIEFVSELPKTISNKTKRADIRKRDAQAAEENK